MSGSTLTRDQTILLSKLPPDKREAFLRMLSPRDTLILDADFEQWAHEGQHPPSGEGWRVWLMMAGRGYGKTRAGAEWINKLATQRGRAVRIALVGATEDEVRSVMIEGESGLMAVARGRARPVYEPSLKRLRWPGGSQAFVYSAENPEALRGPQHHYAWCDELAKWRQADAAWDNLQMTLRCGERPRALVTTTPRAVPILTRIANLPNVVQTTGRTDDNAHLSEHFVQAMVATYGGTRLGRQELDGELIADVAGSLWPRELIERSRQSGPLAGDDFLVRVVIGVDPPASAHGDACGIVAVGLGRDGAGYVIGDHSIAGLSPDGWARAVAEAYALHGADRVIAEKNMGGDMVEAVLRGAALNLPVTGVHASRGKVARAEPVAALFEKGRAMFAGVFPALEDELAGLCTGGRYEGPGRSPDRADAMVWAMSALMLGKEQAVPRVRVI